MTKVIVADNHSVVRTGISQLIDLEKDMEVVGEASDGREAVEMCRKIRPDIVVMECNMPGIDGLEATRRIVEMKLGAKVLILTIFDKRDLALIFIKSGASGYLSKKASAVEFLTAIRKVESGDIYFSASDNELESLRDDFFGEENWISQLSNREYQIFIRMSQGMTMNETADDLNISYSSVKTFKHRIMEKLNIKKIRISRSMPLIKD